MESVSLFSELMLYIISAQRPCNFLAGYDGSGNEWDDYSRYVNPDGVEITSVSIDPR